LAELEVGTYAELASRPNPKHFTIQYVPSLAALLLSAEKKKGQPLTQSETEALRDRASATVVLPTSEKQVEDRRGYKDIDPAHAWQEWQVLRLQFTK
jgi:hypothetical protein